MCLSLYSLQLPSPGKLNPLSQRPHPGINSIPLILQPLTLRIKILERRRKHLYKLILLQFGLQVLVLRLRHIHSNMYHIQICVAEARICLTSQHKYTYTQIGLLR